MSAQRLEKILESLELEERRPGRVTAKVLPLERSDIQTFIGVSDPDNLHFLVGPVEESAAKDVEDVKLKNLECKMVNWSVDGKPERRFLDVSCLSQTDSGFRKPFLGFAEHIFDTLSDKNVGPGRAVKNVFKKWRRFWLGGEAALPSEEWIKGLIGELQFLSFLIQDGPTAVVDRWEGPQDAIYDFRGETVAFEIKSTAGHPLQIRVNSLTQFDNENFDFLFLVVYRLEKTVGGKTLTNLVNQIEAQIGADEETLELFWERLSATGYRRDHEFHYDKFPFQIEEPAFYKVDDDFPKLTSASFSMPIDNRIFEIRYSIELTGLKSLNLDAPEVRSGLRDLRQ